MGCLGDGVVSLGNFFEVLGQERRQANSGLLPKSKGREVGVEVGRSEQIQSMFWT